MTGSQTQQESDPLLPGDLAGLVELGVVRSALLLEPSGRVRGRAGSDDRSGLRRAPTFTAALHSMAARLAEAAGTGDVSRASILAEAGSILLLPVPTRGIPLLLLVVCDTEESEELNDGLATFLEKMKRTSPDGDARRTDELGASLLEGLERLFPPDDDLVE